MKQRLLYTALMLFAVLGMARAAVTTDVITLTVPKGKSATIATVSGANGIVLKVDGTSKELTGNSSYTVDKNDADEQTVTLSGNGLTSLEITGNASALTINNNGLETLKASGLGLETLTFTSATGLKDLNVSNNKLSGGFAGTALAALVTLDASNNKISSFPSAFISTAITSIKFSNNKVTGASFTQQTKLETLEIENNELTSLSVPSTIKTLKVGGNRLTRITGAPDKGVTWGTQTISAKDITDKTANGGFDMAATSLNLLFAKAKLTDVEWDKISDSDIKWERQKDGTTYETVTHGVRKHKASYPSTFYFYDSNNIYTSGTYRATITYNGVTMIVEDIKIDPAKFKITIGSDVHVAKEKSAIKNQEEVSQGDILVVTAKKEGYDLKEFAFSNMQLVDGSTATTNPATFRVEGKWDATNSTDLLPAISASFVDEQVTVKCNDVAASEGSVKITATKGDKITAVQLGETGTKVAKNSTIEIRIAPQVGYEATLAIGGNDHNITLNDDGVYVHTIEGKDVIADQVISVNMKKKTGITLTVKLEGAMTKIDDGTLALVSVIGTPPNGQTQLWIDNTNAKSLSLSNLEIGKKVQIYFALTKQAVEGIGENFPLPRTIQDVKLNTQVLKYVTEKVTPNGDQTAALQYTASFVVPPTDATLTITTKTLTKVEIKAEGTANQQKYTYDGTAKPFKFTTVPAGLESEMIVKYRASNLTDQTAFAKDAPVAAGTYKVSYSMDATTDHAGIAEDNSTYTIVIEAATPQITKIPTVDVKDGKYVITGGEAKFGDTVLRGRFRVTSDGDNNINETTQDATKKEAHVVTVKFVAENTDGSDNSNFKPAEVNTKSTFEGEGTVEEYTVAVADLPEGVSLVMYNGSNIVASGSKVPKGTKLKFVATIPENMYMGVSANPAAHLRTTTDLDGSSGEIYADNPIFDLEKGTIEYTLKTGITKGEVYTIVGLALQVDKNFKVELPEQKVAYTGNAHFYPLDKVIVKNSNDGRISNLSTAFATSPIQFSYKDKDGNIVALPKDAGKYTVVVTIPYQGRNSENYKLYKEFTGEFVAALVITPVETELTTAPRPTLIAKNQALKQSELIGGLVKTKDASKITVAGTFDWKNKSATPRDGDICDVVFTPANTNYTGFETTVRIAVSDKNLVTFAQPVGLGVITVSDDKSNVYETGKEVLDGTILSIQALALDGFELKSIVINGKQYTSSPVSYTVKDESVAIEAIFQPKVIEPEPEDPIIDPNSQYAVTLPKANDVRGVVIGKPGVNAVLKDKPFSFTLNTLAADADKVVVKVNGSELKPANGTYTIAKVSENTTVQISLANPTPLNVAVETIAKNANGYVMGKVQVEGPLDGVCYYNDKITLVAYPESGVTFIGWSDDKDAKSQLRTLTVTKDVTIKALFSGIPTGIEAIQTAKVYGVEGYLVIEGVAKGKVTVVGMDGRVQYYQVSGDIRIPLATGVYGYVLEDGSKVIRNKVYVK